MLNALNEGGSLGGISFGDLGAPDGNGSVRAAETTGILGSITLPSGTRQSVFTGANIVINTNPQASFIAGYGSTALSSSNIVNRAITLIHELGHAANIIYGAGSSKIQDDQNDPTGKTSKDNSKLVKKNCF